MPDAIIDPADSRFAGPCPRCGGGVPNDTQKGEYPGALSRLDNETYICSNCGMEEAFGHGHIVPFDIPLGTDESRGFVKGWIAAVQYARNEGVDA